MACALLGWFVALVWAAAAGQPGDAACDRGETCASRPLAVETFSAVRADLGEELSQRGAGVSWLQARASSRPKAASSAEVAFVGPGSHSDSIYCWMAIVSSSYEAVLVKHFWETNTSLFSCPGHTVFSDAAEVGGVPLVDVGSLECPNLWFDNHHKANSGVFKKVWEKMVSLGIYKQFAWTVKIDADACFLPERLAQHVAGLDPRLPVTVGSRMEMFGAAEVFSKGAIDVYADRGIQACSSAEGLPLPDPAGEDAWIYQCMVKLKVLNRKDEFLVGSRKMGVTECTGTRVLVYHDYKVLEDHKACLADMRAADAAAK